MRLFLAIVLLAATSLALAQTYEPSTGFPPFESFDPGSFDTVNHGNLNLHFAIPVVSSPARGMDLTFAVAYDSSIWVKNYSDWSPVSAFHGPAGTASPTWGWKINDLFGDIRYKRITDPCILDDITEPSQQYYDFKYVEPDGTVHPFDITFHTFETTCGYGTGPTSGHATDGSGYFLDASSISTLYVISPSGTKITASGTVTDANGNFESKVVVEPNTTIDWRDTTGRVAVRTVKGTNYLEYRVPDPAGGTQVTRLNYLNNFKVKTNFQCAGVSEYSEEGISLPVELVLPNGKSYHFDYEATPGYSGWTTGRVKEVTLPTGGTYTYTYGPIRCADATLTSLTRAVSDSSSTATWVFGRSQDGLTTTVTPPVLPYDSAANETKITFSGGRPTKKQYYQGTASSGTLLRTVETSFGGGSTPTAVTTTLDDGRKSKTETTYDNYGNLLTVKEYSYGSGTPGPIVRTMVNSYLTTTEYASRNIRDRVTQTIIREGGDTGTIRLRTDIAYDGTALTCRTGASQHDDSGHGCTFTTRGNPTSTTDYVLPATGSSPISKSFYYDSLGNLLRADLDCCQQKEWIYSSAYQYAYPTSVVNGSAGGPQLTTSASYNVYTGLVETTTDENLKTTSFAYDVFRRLDTITRPDLAVTDFDHDDTNRIITRSDPIQGSDRRVERTYGDPLGRPIKTEMRNAGGTVFSVVETEYDPLNRPYRTRNPYVGTPGTAYWTETRFDGLGRVLKVIPPDGSVTTNHTSYSYAGSAVTVTDPTGRQRKHEYDAQGRMAKAFEPDVDAGDSLTQETDYSYTVLGDLGTVTQGAQTRSYAYDGLRRLTDTTTPEGGPVHYDYNSFGLVTHQTDARGVVTNYDYDTLNRLWHVSYDTGSTGVPTSSTVTYTYGTSTATNTNGRLVTMTNGSVTASYQYDILGRVTQQDRLIDETTYTLHYGYNLAGEPTSVTYPSGKVLSRAYDGIGRQSTLTWDGTTILSGITYNAVGQVTGFSQANGVVGTFGYTPQRLLLSSLAYSKSGTDLLSLNYSTNESGGTSNGHITRITDNVIPPASLDLTYDALNRLKTAESQGGSGGGILLPAKWKLSWTYDRYGNRTAQTALQGAPPQSALTVSTATNRIANSGYSYDASGNMTSDGVNTFTYDAAGRMVTAATGGVTTTYAYDGHGMRIKRTTGGTTTTYLMSGAQVVGEYTGGGVSKEFVYGGDQLVATQEDSVQSSVLKYHYSDHLSIRATANATGTVLGQQGHYPFGESWYETVAVTTRRFTSYDRSSSLFDSAVARNYAPNVARFFVPDSLAGSLAAPQSFNRYSYVGGDPVNAVDPMGLQAEPPIWWAGFSEVPFVVGASASPPSGSVGGGSFGVSGGCESWAPGGVTAGHGPLRASISGFGGDCGRFQFQFSKGTGTERPSKLDLCGPKPREFDASVPPGRSVDKNIEELLRQPVWNRPFYALDMVRTGGDWNYKARFGNEAYRPFGNYNAGAACNIVGFSSGFCAWAGGAYSWTTNGWFTGQGTPIPLPIQVPMNSVPLVIPPTPPYGDLNEDGRAVQDTADGYDYATWYRCMHGLPASGPIP